MCKLKGKVFLWLGNNFLSLEHKIFGESKSAEHVKSKSIAFLNVICMVIGYILEYSVMQITPMTNNTGLVLRLVIPYGLLRGVLANVTILYSRVPRFGY